MGTESLTLKISNVAKIYNDKKVNTALENISFNIKQGEILTLLGPSGCGKSTLLNLIGGFDRPTSGEIYIDGDKVTKPSTKAVTIFQNYGLLPWRNALKNIELGLEEKELTNKERRELALHYLKLVGLEDKADLFPAQLSGGMQQRVALARALAIQPRIILMDEPFAALDTFTRYYLQEELLNIWKKETVTILLVTHDIDEAVYLSRRVLIMKENPGRITKEVAIELPYPRARNSEDFQYYRQQIFRQFQLSREYEIDYTL